MNSIYYIDSNKKLYNVSLFSEDLDGLYFPFDKEKKHDIFVVFENYENYEYLSIFVPKYIISDEFINYDYSICMFFPYRLTKPATLHENSGSATKIPIPLSIKTFCCFISNNKIYKFDNALFFTENNTLNKVLLCSDHNENVKIITNIAKRLYKEKFIELQKEYEQLQVKSDLFKEKYQLPDFTTDNLIEDLIANRNRTLFIEYLEKRKNKVKSPKRRVKSNKDDFFYFLKINTNPKPFTVVCVAPSRYDIIQNILYNKRFDNSSYYSAQQEFQSSFSMKDTK